MSESKTINKTAIIITLLLIAGSLAAYFLYLENNRYISETADGYVHIVDSRSGESWLLHQGKKIPFGEPEPEPEPLPFAEINKLEGRASISSSGYFESNIYNGSDYRISELKVRIIVENSDGTEAINRIYTIRPSYSADPYENTEFSAGLGIRLDNRKWSWGKVSTTGILK